MTEAGLSSRNVRVGVLISLAFLTSPAAGYTLFGFPNNASIQAGMYSTWNLDQVGPPTLNMSYAIDTGSFADVDGAVTAIESAFSSWDFASAVVGFANANYAPVVNSDANIAGASGFEGPTGTGLGANIDIFMVPTGFQTNFLGKTFTMGADALGTTFAHRWGTSGEFNTVDVYLNSDFGWSTVGSHFDLETVILHEVGHALGLDHPDQAVANGAQNYDPYTHQPGKASSVTDVMHSLYFPDGINRDLGDDEIGGLAFLYPGVEGDADLDNDFDYADVQLAIDMYFGIAEDPNPEAHNNINVYDGDGNVGKYDFLDLNILINRFFFPDQSSPGGAAFSLNLLESMGYDTTGLGTPEPHSAMLLLVAFGVCRPGRRKRVKSGAMAKGEN